MKSQNFNCARCSYCGRPTTLSRSAATSSAGHQLQAPPPADLLHTQLPASAPAPLLCCCHHSVALPHIRTHCLASLHSYTPAEHCRRRDGPLQALKHCLHDGGASPCYIRGWECCTRSGWHHVAVCMHHCNWAWQAAELHYTVTRVVTCHYTRVPGLFASARIYCSVMLQASMIPTIISPNFLGAAQRHSLVATQPTNSAVGGKVTFSRHAR
jgi:hypothetical protein